MNKLARILTEKQTSYHQIDYHEYLPYQTKCIPVSIRIPESFYNEIDSGMEINPIPVGTKDSFLLALLYLFGQDSAPQKWMDKYIQVHNIKRYLEPIPGIRSELELELELDRGRLLSTSTIKSIAQCFGIHILLVKARSVLYLTCSNKTAITIVILESDREIYYPLAIDGILIHGLATSSFLDSFRSEKMKLIA